MVGVVVSANGTEGAIIIRAWCPTQKVVVERNARAGRSS